MRPVLIGTAADARAFALAGVDAYVCSTREEATRRVNQVLVESDDAVLILSAQAADLLDAQCERWRRTAGGPLFVTLPR